MPLLDIDPGQSPEAPGTLYFYEQGQSETSGVRLTSWGVIHAPGGVDGPLDTTSVTLTGAATTTDVITTQVTGDAVARHVVDADGKHWWGGGTLALDTNLYRSAADTLKTDDALIVTGYTTLAGAQTNGDFNSLGNLTIGTAGKGLLIKQGGAAATAGSAVLVGGTKVVTTTAVTATTQIQLTSNIDGGTPGWLRVSARTAGTSFTITSSSGTDTSTVGWVFVEPAP